jgi:arginyl-tRNA synthetase
VQSIFRRLGSPWQPTNVTFSLADPAARTLALGLSAFPEHFASALETSQPHKLCNYLFDLAQRFTSFYDACPVLSAEGALRDERLALCDVSARTLALGLHLLGIDAPDQM